MCSMCSAHSLTELHSEFQLCPRSLHPQVEECGVAKAARLELKADVYTSHQCFLFREGLRIECIWAVFEFFSVNFSFFVYVLKNISALRGFLASRRMSFLLRGKSVIDSVSLKSEIKHTASHCFFVFRPTSWEECWEMGDCCERV